MTQEDKELLLKDLCARLPYRVMCHVIMVKQNHEYLGHYEFDLELNIQNLNCLTEYSDIKPYLRPMSSMTEEEKKECCSIFNYSMYQFEVNKYGDVESTEPTVEKECLYYDAELMAKWLDWLNSRHFDFRNLIEKGLALEAPANMYKIK